MIITKYITELKDGKSELEQYEGRRPFFGMRSPSKTLEISHRS